MTYCGGDDFEGSYDGNEGLNSSSKNLNMGSHKKALNQKVDDDDAYFDFSSDEEFVDESVLQSI